MMSSLILILLSFISQAAAYPTADTNAGISNLTSLADGIWPTNLPNGTVVFNNVTAGDERFNEHWQYDNSDECKWAMSYIPFVSSECTEYCDADTYNWGKQYHRLRYHIRLSGNGQDPHLWCDNFRVRMMRDCAVRKPDFFNCNTGRAPASPMLDSWAATPAGVVKATGINLRFDFSPYWNSRDAQHDCVRSAIREATCAGTVFTNGLRCIPVLYKSPNAGTAEFDESYVPPNPRCLYTYEVPEEST
ncbi:hypothetical protein GL218_07006 [Daldinia childiae]|uniref:uncharacterized protein n=1 Tax=Daldinia childiae TaxID=326645 RepID=UPI001448680C|nr:uncharacterized protein GL218_07006 [Daldinia childiae]KAF3055824.1 hypothetical protein GL218_07006 [Daldinia childiae]